MTTVEVLLLICGGIIAYLLGSIPSSVWIGRIFFGKDVRQYGSGNAGATNTFRTFGWKAGVFVLVFDVFKGWMAVFISSLFTSDYFSSEQVINYEVICAALAVVGHVYPIFAGFKGGKGVATLVGIMIALLPWETATAVVIFIIVMLLSGYVSLSSIIAGILFPVIVIFLPKIFLTLLPAAWSEIFFAFLIAVFIPITHLKNIKRLLKGTEKKLFSKNDKDGSMDFGGK
ncbi:MAG: glycerol-3-phosphate 1-O-acyltransferase PlsY [Bacteroidales bacterium]|jgi:glycerol-3-phosphate acyltransferase PlsY|nr:glycerol-3-phosphate 1-O-acyltransferase PlsY [Bacteroidales bacterium]